MKIEIGKRYDNGEGISTTIMGRAKEIKLYNSAPDIEKFVDGIPIYWGGCGNHFAEDGRMVFPRRNGETILFDFDNYRSLQKETSPDHLTSA